MYLILNAYIPNTFKTKCQSYNESSMTIQKFMSFNNSKHLYMYVGTLYNGLKKNHHELSVSFYQISRILVKPLIQFSNTYLNILISP